mgnify:CR=1 FL=1
MITVENLDVVFGRGTPLQKQALNRVNLTIDTGSFVTVIGSNGAGKSTLLGVLAGDILPTGGRVTIGKTDVTRKATASRAGLVARVFQDPLARSASRKTWRLPIPAASAAACRLRLAAGGVRFSVTASPRSISASKTG